MIEPIYNRDYFRDRNDELKNRHIQDIKDLIEYFKTRLNITLHIHYGTLLGTIREHDFISHDKDIDLVYISSYDSKEAVAKEIITIEERLISDNMLVKTFNHRGQMHVRVPKGSLVVDVFTSWIANDRYYLIPFGEICSSKLIIPLLPLGWIRENCFDIPNQSESLLDILYKDWKNPILKDDKYLKLNKRSIL